MVLIAVNTK